MSKALWLAAALFPSERNYEMHTNCSGFPSEAPKVGNPEATKAREGWIDVLRGLAILMLLVLHRNTLPGIRTYLNSFLMPLFFAISGYLFHPERHPKVLPFIGSRAVRLLLPYVFFSLLSIPYEIWYAWRMEVPWDKSWLADMLDKLLVLHGEVLSNSPVWFLPSLFSVELVFFFVARIHGKRMMLIALAGFAGLGYILSAHIWPYPKLLFWNANFSAILLCFYGFGYLLRDWIGKVDLCRLMLCVSLSLTIGLWGQLWGNKLIYYYLQRSPMDFILFHAQALSSIIAFFAVARIMPGYSFLQYLGRNSMLLFGAHFVVYQAFDLVNRKLRLDTPEPILSLYVVVTALAVLVPCCEVVNRYFPWVVGNRSRCRKPL